MKLFKFFRSSNHGKAETGSTVLPSDWPSELHSKCSVPTCWYPNSPQAAVGIYNCLGGRSQGRQCKGVYTVTDSMLTAMIESYHRMRREELLRARQSIEAAKGRRPSVIQRKPSRATTVARKPQRLCKEKSFRSLNYQKDKSLPGIPGLSQRKVNKGPLAFRPPFPIQAPVDVGQYPEVHVRCIFPQDESAALSQPAFSTIPQKPGPSYVPFRPPLVVSTRTLSKDLGFSALHSHDSISVRSQITNDCRLL